MRKFIVIMLSIFFIFACDLKLPKEITVTKQSPELRFKADIDEIDLIDVFGDAIDYDISGGDTRMIDCNNTDIFTKIIYMTLYDDDICNDSSIDISYFRTAISAYGGIVPPALPPLLTSTISNIQAPDLAGTQLNDFSLEALLARLYISGTDSDILDALCVELEIKGNSLGEFRKSQASGLYSTTVYNGESLPPCSNKDFYLFEDSGDIDINYSIYLKEGKTIDESKFDAVNFILVELAVWVPYVFVADTDTELDLPFDDLFTDSGDDLFGRKSASDDDNFIENIDNIHLEIVMNSNPFPSSILVVKSNNMPGSNEIESVINSNILTVQIDKDEIDYPFTPSFLVRFKEGNKIIVPSIFLIEDFVFKAKLHYTIEL